MSEWVPTTFRETWDPHHFRTNSKAEARHKKVGLHTGVPDPKAPPPPVIEDTEAAQQDQADLIRRRRGRAASILTGGNAGVPVTASKALLGS